MILTHVQIRFTDGKSALQSVSFPAFHTTSAWSQIPDVSSVAVQRRFADPGRIGGAAQEREKFKLSARTNCHLLNLRLRRLHEQKYRGFTTR
ncbi:hypothetical protein AMEX_G7967 [Astyanax mexicanus]|uniref:Uncharacterized protein n=1 Tax=Astyanax mexicanus TaxID=7994 RepID=A0A8T2M4D3_ASTMX|nr:hypothetical protein AMEX_G7967 [Astyanax mexicanus]